VVNNDIEAVEAVRARYCPKRIKTLFVGESPPASGAFFYCRNNAMLHHMQRAVELALGENGNFLELQSLRLVSRRLVLTPVNKLTKSERKGKCLDAQKSLADRIAAYQPEAILSLLMFIKPFVDAAAITAGSNAPLYAVPFPGMGHQGPFQAAMACIIPKLPRLTEPA
jgi:hypothetical protein